jgi:hypothetical protein
MRPTRTSKYRVLDRDRGRVDAGVVSRVGAGAAVDLHVRLVVLGLDDVVVESAGEHVRSGAADVRVVAVAAAAAAYELDAAGQEREGHVHVAVRVQRDPVQAGGHGGFNGRGGGLAESRGRVQVAPEPSLEF